MNKAELHALVDEVWRRKVSMASMSTESMNALLGFKDEMHKEIDAMKEDQPAAPTNVSEPEKD
jgi:hypothetical protein